MMNVMVANCGTLLLNMVPMCSPKSFARSFLPLLAFSSPSDFLMPIASESSQPTATLSIQYCWNNPMVAGPQLLPKASSSASRRRVLLRGYLTQYSPLLVDWSFFSRNPATLTVIDLLNPLYLANPILLPNCLKENSVCFRLDWYLGALEELSRHLEMITIVLKSAKCRSFETRHQHSGGGYILVNVTHHLDIFSLCWRLIATRVSGWLEKYHPTAKRLGMNEVKTGNHSHTAGDIDWFLFQLDYICQWHLVNYLRMILNYHHDIVSF